MVKFRIRDEKNISSKDIIHVNQALIHKLINIITLNEKQFIIKCLMWLYLWYVDVNRNDYHYRYHQLYVSHTNNKLADDINEKPPLSIDLN